MDVRWICWGIVYFWRFAITIRRSEPWVLKTEMVVGVSAYFNTTSLFLRKITWSHQNHSLGPRPLLNEMIKRMPDGITTDGELVPGGDLRNRGNLWLRSSYQHSGLKKVPRETQIRLVVMKLIKKKKVGSLINHVRCEMIRIIVFYA